MDTLIPVIWRERWGDMVPGLQRVAEESHQAWSLESVREELEGQSAFAWSPGGDPGAGLLVLKAQRDPDGSLVLFIWIAWSPSGSAIETHWEELKSLGRRAGFDRIEFRSPRKGWLRLAEGMGVQPVSTIYRGDL